MDRVYTIAGLLGGHLLAAEGPEMSGRSKSTVTLSVRVSVKQAEQIRVAAFAANQFVSEYIYRRLTRKPILATPALAALAELMSTLRRLEAACETGAEPPERLRQEVHRLCSGICDHEKIQ